MKAFNQNIVTKSADTQATSVELAATSRGNEAIFAIVLQRRLNKFDCETIPILIDEQSFLNVLGLVLARKGEAAFNNSLVFRTSRISRRSLATSATRSSGKGSVTRLSRRAACTHCWAIYRETYIFRAPILHASRMDMFSARMRSSTRQTTRSLVSR